MVRKTLKKLLNRLRQKHVHRIDDSTSFFHRSYATSCNENPTTSTKINEGAQKYLNERSLSEHSFAVCLDGTYPSESTNQIEFDLQAKVALERTFQRYFGDSRIFALAGVRCNQEAYNDWIRLKHARDTLERMMDFCSYQNHKMDGSELIMDTYLRFFYDFVVSAMQNLESSYPNLHNYHSRRQNRKNQFYSEKSTKYQQFSESSGYSSVSSSYSMSPFIGSKPIYESKKRNHNFSVIFESDEEEEEMKHFGYY